MGNNDPVCGAFVAYEGAVSNCINAAMTAHQSEKDAEFFRDCVAIMKSARKLLADTYHTRVFTGIAKT